MGTRGGLAMRLWALCGHSEKVSTVFLAPHMSIHRQIWAVFLKNRGIFGQISKNNIEIGIQMGFYDLTNIFLGGLR